MEQPSCTSAAPTPEEKTLDSTWGAGSVQRPSELGRDAGGDVGAADVTPRRVDVVLLVEAVGVLDRDLLVVVLGADALGVDGLDDGGDVLLPVQALPAPRPEVVVEVEEPGLLRDHRLHRVVDVVLELRLELRTVDVEVGQGGEG